ncbi:ATP-binding protein [Nonomuraea sp. SYSU D8015]|uniref:ATP-binding protein n=1 Tax=Nonomuraea sp. SYSU D8015 TaxID=2593644 RepID=UPI00166029AF|nr:ATP-binding protein [Nonomuraea sp. SYSU D8015]
MDRGGDGRAAGRPHPPRRQQRSGDPARPGSQAHATLPAPETGRKAVGDGLGLGLSIVASIVEAHHGTVEARPLPDGGLEVTVTLDHQIPGGTTAQSS